MMVDVYLQGVRVGFSDGGQLRELRHGDSSRTSPVDYGWSLPRRLPGGGDARVWYQSVPGPPPRSYHWYVIIT